MLDLHEYKFKNYKINREKMYPLDINNIDYSYDKELVSIVLPVYNGEGMIDKTIESILNQTYKNFELIIVNDGCTDNTGIIIEKYRKMDNRIKVIHQENQKIPKALSKGFRIANGEFHTWISADNLMGENFIEQMVNYLNKNKDVAMVYANIRLIDADGNLITNHQWYQVIKGSPIVSLPKDTLKLNIYEDNTIGAAFMYRGLVTQLIEDYSEYKYTLEDYDYWMRINSLFNLKHIDNDRAIYDYRFHEKSLTARDKELGITAGRYKLMVLDDFRRDFYLSSIIWVTDSNEYNEIFDQLTDFTNKTRSILLKRSELNNLTLSELGTPIVYLKVCTKSNECEPNKTMLPVNAYRVLILNSSDINICDINEKNWDCIIKTKKETDLSKLSDYKGVFYVENYQDIFSLIDLKYKNKYLYRIEKNIEDPKVYEKKVSTIICTYKRSQKLVNALNSVINQSFNKKDYEIIVVNNDLNNKEIKQIVDEYISKYSFQYDFIKYIDAPIKGLSVARNIGMFEAKGEILFYIDDDVVCDCNCIEETYNCFKNHPEAGVIGGEIKLNLSNKKPNVLLEGMEALWSQFIINSEQYIESNYYWEFPYGANFAVRKEALLRIGGFRTSYGRKGNDFAGGEEIVVSSLMKNIGYKIGRNPKMKVIHDPDLSRYTFEHVRRTIKAGVITLYQLQKDLYIPMNFNIGNDIQYVKTLIKEIENLKNENIDGKNDLDIFYKKCYLEAYAELVKEKILFVKDSI